MKAIVKGFMITLILGAIAGGTVWGLFFNNSSHGKPAAAAATYGPRNTMGPQAGPNLAAYPAFKVHLDPNKGANFFSGGISPQSETMRKQVADGAARDPRILMEYNNAMPARTYTVKDVTELAPLKNGADYTPYGRSVYESWVAIWNNPKLTQITPTASLPAVGTNTGAMPGGAPFAQTGNIPAGAGHKVDYYDAQGRPLKGGHYVANKCGNVISSTPIPGIIEKIVGVIQIITHPRPPGTPPPPYDECRNVPGNQPPGYPCSKVGQIGSIGAGHHDPQGGSSDQSRNPTTTQPDNPSRPIIPNPDQPSPSGGGSGSGGSGSGGASGGGSSGGSSGSSSGGSGGGSTPVDPSQSQGPGGDPGW